MLAIDRVIFRIEILGKRNRYEVRTSLYTSHNINELRLSSAIC